ncbi:hypothetical protein ABPG74_018950 [Tetrahymena malaccensis]
MDILNEQDILYDSNLAQTFKYRIFQLIDKMIDFHHKSLFIEILYLIIQTFQVIGLLDQPWMQISSITSYVQEFMQTFLFVPQFKNTNNPAQFQSFFYFCSTFILIIIISLIYASLFISQNQTANAKLRWYHKTIYSFFDFLLSSISQVLYIPLFQLFISSFKCEKNLNNKYSSTKSESTYFNVTTKDECLAVSQIPNLVLSLICIALLYFICSYFNTMCFDTRLDCSYKNSKINGNYELSLQYFISTFCLIDAALYEDKYSAFKTFIAFLYSYYLLKQLINSIPHNFKLIYMIKLEQALILFCLQLIGAYNYFFQENTVVVFFLAVGIIFLTILNIHYEPVTSEICAANSFNFRYVEEVLQQLRVLCFAITKYDQYSVKVDGFLNRHRSDCNDIFCPSRSNSLRLQKLNKALTKQTANEDLTMSIYVIFTIFDSNIQKFGGSNQIRLFYALFLFETLQNKDQSLIQLTFILQNQPNLQEEFACYRLKKIILQQQNFDRENKKLDFSLEAMNEESSNRFIKVLNNQIQNLLEFWLELLETTPQAENLIKCIQTFSSQTENIQNQFGQMIQQRNLNISAINFYQSFCLQILEDEEQFFSLQSKINIKNTELDFQEDEQQQYDLNEDNMYTKGSIVITSQEENFSNIIEVNSEMLKIVGYTKSEILYKNVQMLIPNIWQHHHNQFIDQFLATGQKQLIGQQKNLFIKSRQNYCLPVTLKISTITSLTKGLMFQACVTAQNLLYDYPVYIITQPNGKIDTISPSAVPMFNIQIKKINRVDMYIEKIIPQFWEYILEFQQKQGKELCIKTYQQEMMKQTKVKISVQQIRFMKLTCQGYIIKIILLEQLQNSSQINLKNANIDQNIVKPQQKTISLSSLQDKMHQIQQEDSKNISNEDFTESSTSSKTIKTRNNLAKLKNSNKDCKNYKMEIFYDVRTNTFLGAMIEMQDKSEYEDTLQSMRQKLIQQQVFNLLHQSKQENQILPIMNDENQFKQKLYPFIFTSERSQKERIQDILDSNDISQQKDDSVSKQVRQILENLIKMQHKTRKKQPQASFQAEKKSIQVGTSEIKIIPQVYLKPHEISVVQEDYKNRVQYILFNNSQISSKVQKMKQSGTSKMYMSYSREIKTLRLENNKLVDPYLARESEESNNEDSIENLENDLKIKQNEGFDEGEYKKEIDESFIYYQEISSVLTTIPFSKIRDQVKIYQRILNNTVEEQEENEVLNQDNEEEDEDDEKENQDQNNQLGNLDNKQFNNNQIYNFNFQETKSPKSNYDYNKDSSPCSQQNQNVKISQNQNNSSDNTTFHLRGESEKQNLLSQFDQNGQENT